MNKHSKILITGSGGMVGSAVLRLLKDAGYDNLLTPRKAQLDLCDTTAVISYFKCFYGTSVTISTFSYNSLELFSKNEIISG